MRIGVAQNIRWTAPGAECEQDKTAEVEAQWHQQPPQEWRREKVRDDAERIRGLVPGEDKVCDVHEDSGAESGFGHVKPRTAPPRTFRSLIRWLLRDTAPTQTQGERDKDKEQESGRKFGKKSARQNEPKLDDGAARGRSPHLRKLPNGEHPEQRDHDIGDYERAEREKCRHAHEDAEAQQTSPDASQTRAKNVYGKAKKQGEQQHGHSGPKDGGIGIVPTHDEPVAEHPLSQELIEVLATEGPGNMRVVGIHPLQDKRQRRYYLRQRWVFLVHPQIQLLEIAHAGADVRYFIDRDRLPPRSPARQHRHGGEKRGYGQEGGRGGPFLIA